MAKKKNGNQNNDNTGDEVEKKEEGNKKGGDGGEKKEEKNSTPVVLEVEMHCEGCVSKIVKCVRAFEGVESVKAEAGSSKLTVTGKVDPLKIRDYLHRKTKKKVNLISPQPKKEDPNNKSKEEKKSDDKKPDTDNNKLKEPPVTTAVLKLGLHCQGCIEKIYKIVHKTKGVQEMALDKDKELVTVKGTMDVKALTEALRDRLKRSVDVVPPKKEKDGGKEGDDSGGGKKKGGGGNGGQVGGGGGGGGGAKMEQSRMEFMVQPGFGPGFEYVGQPIYGNGFVGQPVYASYGLDYGNGFGHGQVPGYPDHLRFNDENPNACAVM